MLGRALAVCGVRVGDLVWYSQSLAPRKESDHPRRLHVRSQIPHSAVSPGQIPKTVVEGVMCVVSGAGIVFLRIIGESNSCLAQISFFAIDRGFHPQFEFQCQERRLG